MLILGFLFFTQSVMAQDTRDELPSDVFWDALRADDVPGVIAQIESGRVTANSATLAETPLCYAIKRDSIEMVAALLDHGANPNMPQPVSLFTPLMVAAKHNNPDAVQLLLARKANVNFTSVSGRNPLHVAALHHSMEVAHLLLTQTDVEVNTRGKLCPLAVASRQGYLDFVTLILKEAKVAPSEGCLSSAKEMAKSNVEAGSQHEAILTLLNSLK